MAYVNSYAISNINLPLCTSKRNGLQYKSTPVSDLNCIYPTVQHVHESKSQTALMYKLEMVDFLLSVTSNQPWMDQILTQLIL
jgi:hypothetical protein